MINLERIVIQDFLSIENIDYTFKEGIPIAITGVNLDNNGQAKNGVGKSSFIEPIAMLTTGLTLRDCLSKELVRNGQEKAVIEGYYRNTHDNRILHIKRVITTNTKPQECYITYGTEEIHKTLDDINSKNAWILNELGITQEDFFQFFLITKEKYKPFLKASDTTKKDIINRFSGADKIDDIDPILEKESSSLENLIKQFEIDVDKLNSQIQIYVDEISKTESENSSEKKQEKINNIELQIEQKNIEVLDFDDKSLLLNNELKVLKSKKTDNELLKEDYDTLISEVKKLQLSLEENIQVKKKELSELDVTFDAKKNIEFAEIKSLNISIEDKEKTIRQRLDEFKELNKEKSEIENKLLKSIVCPKCEHEFTIDKDFDIVLAKNRLNEIELESKSVKADMEEVATSVQAIVKQIDDVKIKIKSIELEQDESKKDIRVEIQKLNDSNFTHSQEIQSIHNRKNDYSLSIMKIDREISSKENEIKLIENNIETVFQEVCGLEKQIEIINNEDIDSRKKDYLEAIMKIDKQKIIKEEALEAEKLKKDVTEQWKINFKNFKSYLANQSIKSIENYTNLYLKEMNSDLSIKIEGYKVDKKKVTEKITTTIYRSGFEFGSYGRFSGGERARIDMAVILAIQTLINLNSRNGFNCIIIDEVMESLDSTGLENIIESLDGIDKVVMIVTQNEINVSGNNLLNLIKENGITTIQ